MSRHPVDHHEPSDGGRMKHFAEVERTSGAEGSHPSAKALTRRPEERDGKNRRAAHYARIERGHRA
ncbi:hypothetical protein [Acidimangrovimonas sediminis]|uniref:hypothetical protein n=1 Tax=Acidimangrovimonas sediminis TaxID=2056283 RepID=UPI000C807C67|nr:hypothetical protein [Acidimangrovimonas sediminis]